MFFRLFAFIGICSISIVSVRAQPDAVQLTDSAMVLHLSGNLQEAMSLYTAAVQLTPNYARAYYNRGLINNELGNTAQAIKDFTQALAFDTALKAAYFNRGIALYRSEQYADAAKDFNRYLHREPQDAEAYLFRGAAYFQQQQYAAAKSDYTRYTLLQPNDAIGWLNLGDVHLVLEEPEAAIVAYTKALQLKATESRARWQRARVYFDQQKFREALADYEVLIQQEQDTQELAQAYFERGDCKQALGIFKEAIEDYSLALLNNPLLADAYFQRSVCYLMLKDYRAAIADMDRYLKFNPQDQAEALYNKGVMLYNLGRGAEACEVWKQAQTQGAPSAASMIKEYCR